MTEDKSKLLRSLTIDRSANKAERMGSRWLPISAAIVACVVAFAAFAAFEFRRQDPPKETVSQTAQQPAAQRQAQSQFETAKIDAKRSASMLEKHQIRAPFAGVVIDRSAQPGEMISPMSVGGYTRTGICTIVDMDSIEIEVDVNEAFIGRVVPGGAVNAMLDAYPDWTIPASA